VPGPNARIAQRADDLEPGGDAGDAVEPPAGRHGIAVRSDRDHPQRGIGPLDAADQIAGGIDPGDKPGFGKRLHEKSTAFEKQRRERASRIGPCRIGDFREPHHIGPEPVRIERQICLHHLIQCFDPVFREPAERPHPA
jgi:hypothetical protein